MIIVNDKELKKFNFPAGEVHFNFDEGDLDNLYYIRTDFSDKDDIMTLLIFCDYIGEEACKKSYLQIFYLPYARQDRKTSENEPFSLKTFCKLINQCNFKEVEIFDPHSDVSPALLNKCNIVDRFEVISREIICTEFNLLDYEIIVSPDTGAIKKNQILIDIYKKLSSTCNIDHIFATKNRDTKTGEITGTKIHSDIEIKDKSLLIIDDICDGGKTFIELSKVIKEFKPRRLDLYITVGIFSKGFNTVKEHFDNIYFFHKFGDLS